MNSRVKSMYCIKCGVLLEKGDYFYGCPYCAEGHKRSNVSFKYCGTAKIKERKRGMLKYGEYLPYEHFPTLGEGDTPLIELSSLADSLELNKVYVKNEFQNPTGSHKDRMNPLIVARAMELNKDTIAVVSSGNQAVSVASYAAIAGLNCIAISTYHINPIWKAAILSTGAELIITNTFEERYDCLKQGVKNNGWYPAINPVVPTIGSNIFGVQGYKTIAYEFFEEFQDDIPEFILVPVSRGDLIFGIYEGFQDLKIEGKISKLPRLVAVEPFARMERVLKGEDGWTTFKGDASLTPSIDGNIATYQTRLAIENTDGLAVSITKDEVLKNVKEMSQHGLYLETSSSLVIGGLKKLIEEGSITPDSRVILVATSGGTKNDPDVQDTIIVNHSHQIKRYINSESKNISNI